MKGANNHHSVRKVPYLCPESLNPFHNEGSILHAFQCTMECGVSQGRSAKENGYVGIGNWDEIEAWAEFAFAAGSHA
jgi:hypothetical protein